MYQQFSLTIAFAVVLSVFNAVTFTPALSALLLKRHEATKQGRFFRRANGIIDARHARLRPWSSRGLLRWEMAMLAIFARRPVGDVGDLSGRAAVVRAERGRGLLHRDHPGAAGASLEYTTESGEAGREDHHGAAGGAGRVLGRRLQLQRLGAEPGADVRAAQTATRSAAIAASR